MLPLISLASKRNMILFILMGLHSDQTLARPQPNELSSNKQWAEKERRSMLPLQMALSSRDRHEQMQIYMLARLPPFKQVRLVLRRRERVN